MHVMACGKPLKVESVEELIQILEHESEKRARSKRTAMAVWLAVFGFYFVMIVGLWIIHHHFPSDFANSMTSFAGITAAVGFAGTHKKALALAAESEDPRLTGFLLEAAVSQERTIGEMAREALSGRLPHVESREQLTGNQRSWLYKSLPLSRDSKYTTAALEAIRRIGDKDAIGPLEAYMKAPSRRRRSWEASAKILAQTVLGDVRMRAAREIIERKKADNRIAELDLIDNLPRPREVAQGESQFMNG